ncbi:polysaccharide deacetylase family protein [Thalassotalea sp. Y01]|uniref:polysaccharide deacetylase family protein n=1 Tax=Thalassotalea sp. Y01 TaxID=2729613 RepID=UPI00145DECA8|nr:polysaccharide deacetylase family protein [Thalassotalea sp. Y01]
MKDSILRLKSRLIRTLKLENLLFKFLPNGIYVFNLHRIGDRHSCQFDRNIFSCGVDQFEQFLLLLKASFDVVDVATLSQILDEQQPINKRLAVITFDDGYKDCIDKAAPLLVKYQLPAAFFITTDFVGSERIPWWDEMAFLLRQSTGRIFKSLSTGQDINLQPNTIEKQIAQVIFTSKRDNNHTLVQILDDMREQFPQARAQLAQQSNSLFMNWQDIHQLKDMGMDIGSHAKTHNILARMSTEQQLHELTLSKQVLEQQLNQPIKYLAYPVGRYHCFDQHTLDNAKVAGYSLAFNNEKGKNRFISERYSINRYCFDEGDLSTLKLNCIVW